MKRATAEHYFSAILNRDPRFDGRFFYGVKTTGIFCRPICPARPLRKNIEFFANAREAQAAGYRACLRCRPEAKPESAAWMGTSAVAQRALKKLNTATEWNEDRFAATFGLTSRHLRRLFQKHIGRTPKQIITENRLREARKLIAETKQPMADIALACGFQSVRRFNDAFKKHYGLAPSQLRTQRSLK